MTATPHTDETPVPTTEAAAATEVEAAPDGAVGAEATAPTPAAEGARKPRRPRKAAGAKAGSAAEAAERAYPPIAPGEADSVLRAEQTPNEEQPYLELGLREDEYARIRQILGRRPTQSELAMYAIMWSEHCSYKSSKVHLRQFAEKAPPSDRLLAGMGDNAKRVVPGVVAGVGGYGNCLGLPNIGGEVGFDPCYQGNPLVNALCVGVLPVDGLQSKAARGPGNVVVLLGAKTGRDGIGGVSVLASATFNDASEQRRPSVQVGDPFAEKLLIEACLELYDADMVVAVQDLGGAGLTCALSETTAAAGTGMRITL